MNYTEIDPNDILSEHIKLQFLVLLVRIGVDFKKNFPDFQYLLELTEIMKDV